MELIYSMRRKPLKIVPPHFENVLDSEVTRPICAISSGNIIAFSSPTELEDTDGDTWGGHVYVCDLDTPWHCHKVTSTNVPVSVLEWDSEGSQLLIATTVGDVSVYGQKDYLMNEWRCVYTAKFPGEHITAAVFFHNGRRFVHTDKKPDAPITERIQLLNTKPTLKGFGGSPVRGCVVVSRSGLIAAVLSSGAVRATSRPMPARTATLLTHAGKILLASPSGDGCCVRCSNVEVTETALLVQPLPPIHLAEPSLVSWVVRDDTEMLMVCNSTVSLWRLRERSYPIHKLFCKGSGNTTPGTPGAKPSTECFNTMSWQQTWGGVHVEGPVSAVGGRAAGVALTPRAIHLLLPDRLQVVTCPVTNLDVIPSGGSSPKKAKYGPGSNGSSTRPWLCGVAVSHLNSCVIALDTDSRLHVYKIHQAPDIPPQLWLQQLASHLEYSMVSGTDCVDLLMALKPNVLDTLYERITESFQRQPASFQQYYYNSWVSLRAAICRQLPSCRILASSLSSLLALQAIWAGVVGGLRPDERNEALAALLDEASEDKKLVDTMPEVVCEGIAMQALRVPLQRALRIALTAVVERGPNQHGGELCSDPSVVHILRAICVLCRTQNRPLTEMLYRLLARPGVLPTECIDEVQSLASATSVSRVCECAPRLATTGCRPTPLSLQYGSEPDWLRTQAQCDAAQGFLVDAVRHTFVGGGAKLSCWRECGRCGALSLPAAGGGRPALHRAMDARYLTGCRCGGKWTLFSNF